MTEILVFENDSVRSATGALWGVCNALNPVHAPELPSLVADTRLIVYSGTPADDLFEAHPLSWGEAAQTASRAWCEGAARAGHQLVLRTHARHVLCDAPRCVAFAAWAAETELSISILLEPESLIEPGMTADLEDHIDRIFRLAARSIDGIILGVTHPEADLDLARLARLTAHAAKRYGFAEGGGVVIAGAEHVDDVTEAFAGAETAA